MLGDSRAFTLKIETLPIVRGLWCQRCHSHSRIRMSFRIEGDERMHSKSVCVNCD